MCQFAFQTTQYDTACSGHVVVAEFGTHTITWSFDADGKFNYELFEDDVPANCKDGKTQSSSWEWGDAPCARAGTAKSFSCDGGGGAGGAGGAGGQGG